MEVLRGILGPSLRGLWLNQCGSALASVPIQVAHCLVAFVSIVCGHSCFSLYAHAQGEDSWLLWFAVAGTSDGVFSIFRLAETLQAPLVEVIGSV